MNIYDTHFKDVKFSTNLKFEIPFSEKNNEDRITILKQLVANKNIIHLGCADHLEIIEKKNEA